MTVKELRTTLDAIEAKFSKQDIEDAILEIHMPRQEDGAIRWRFDASDLCVNRLQIWQDAKKESDDR